MYYNGYYYAQNPMQQYPYHPMLPQPPMQPSYPWHGQHHHDSTSIRDYGKSPYVVNLHNATLRNQAFRRTIWTGKHLQTTLMNIRVGEDIGAERHPATDQFFYIEEGQGYVRIGDRRDHPEVERMVNPGDGIFIPAGKWHNIINIGQRPLKLFSVYAPPEHRFGTVDEQKK
ncbi:MULTISPECIES: cupin domain-containing protein [Bacillales]|uniref:Cupin domain-containing protein n=1 Tax=Lysinibacillus louembei TaxID=1470088 RepID=A0ABZ0RUL4_9BACI|nr:MULTISPECIES: cupin domain-containing protein [Bacillales]MCT6922960.1 cupin domain-containing protein [Metasolibacillus sp.]MCT6939198.1 cupin domain-containing protein [Metasolibacillus sp.]WPK10957.1 cupin domain-containing protein [Lysinibacillus louembei]